MATDADIITKAVDEVLGEIQKHVHEEYARLMESPEQREAIVEAAKSATTEQLALAKELAGQPDDIEQRLRKHLPEGRIELIREGLKLPTFRMDITKKSDGKHWAENPFDEPPRLLETSEDIEWAFVKQAASLLVEVVMFVMSIAGIVVFVNRSVILPLRNSPGNFQKFLEFFWKNYRNLFQKFLEFSWMLK